MQLPELMCDNGEVDDDEDTADDDADVDVVDVVIDFVTTRP